MKHDSNSDLLCGQIGQKKTDNKEKKYNKAFIQKKGKLKINKKSDIT